MKKLLLIAALASLGFSATVVMPYESFVDYSKKSLKKEGNVLGVYFSYFKSPFKIEIDPETTKIKYRDNTSDWNQVDLTTVFHYYVGYNLAFKVGIHQIFIDQNGNNDNYDKVLFGSILYYQYLKYNVGFDYYYSTYNGFNVQQITPKLGFNFGNYYSRIGSFYFQLKGNFINISGNSEIDKKNYSNFDIKLQNFKGKWVREIKISKGESRYKVANDGFVVYDTGDKYRYNIGASLGYFVKKNLSLKAGFSRSKYIIDSNNAYSNTYSISFTKTF